MTASESETTEQRLERLESIAQRLWPFVRYFGLCGADPDATAIVAELADYLGHSESGPQNATEIALKVQERTVKELANWLANHRWSKRRIVAGNEFKNLAEEMRGLLHSAFIHASPDSESEPQGDDTAVQEEPQ